MVREDITGSKSASRFDAIVHNDDLAVHTCAIVLRKLDLDSHAVSEIHASMLVKYARVIDCKPQ